MECSVSFDKKPIHAVLRLQEKQDPRLIGNIQQALAKSHIESFIRTEHDRDTLVIPEIKTENQVIDILSDNGWVKGAPQKLMTPTDKKSEQENNSKSFFSKDPVLLTGMALMVASLSWFGSAIMRAKHNHNGKFTKQDWSEMMVGVVNLSGNIPLLIYGKPVSQLSERSMM